MAIAANLFLFINYQAIKALFFDNKIIADERAKS